MSTPERRRRRRSRSERRRAVYVLPNLATTASLLLGFWAMVKAMEGQFERAAAGIVAAGIVDMLDGRIARATHSTSRFGVEYDSLADVVSFGVAPAFLVYNWTLAPLGPRGWLIASLFAICAALRLARFNAGHDGQPHARHQGLPSTIAGGFVAASVWFVAWLGLAPPFERPVGLAISSSFALVGLLMVSSLPYPSWQAVPVSGRNAWTALVATVLGLVVLLLYREPALFALGVIYVSSGPALWLWQLRRTRAARRARAGVPGESRSDGF